MTGEEQEQYQRSFSKIEEALEVKSLRRIISAYLNYEDAAEEDVRRYERSFRRLPNAHKALLSNFPLKCERLRRCISLNSFFITNMLQAFEPPLDMRQDADICEHEQLENSPKNYVLGYGNFHGQSASSSGPTLFSKTDQTSCRDQSDLSCKSSKGITINEEAPMCSESVRETGSIGLEYNKELDRASASNAKGVSTEATICSVSDADADENVSSPPRIWLDPSFQLEVPPSDVDKVRCIIRNIVRDWTQEGSRERDQCYKPILEELDRLFPSRCKDRPPCCLVPGAGLGRLALEISCLGFISQGNEFSYYMMICSSFILNQTDTAGEWTIYPWVHSNCNSLSDNDQLRPVPFPDILPASAGITGGFSMCGGDFVEVYNDPSHEGSWDAVVTCFFLDTAHNIVEYIEIISRILRDGGVWINFGPLLYHFADAYGTEEEMSIELSLEDVKSVALQYGFQLEREETIETTYTANRLSMMENRYFAAFWTMTKRGTP